MKTAKEWIKETFIDLNLSHVQMQGVKDIMDWRLKLIKTIQLDAWRQGMSDASRIAFDTTTERVMSQMKTDGALDTQLRIEQARDNKKEL